MTTADSLPKLTEVVIDGFSEDCEHLLNQFLAKETLRLKEFIQLWQENKFDLIYATRTNIHELMEFVDEMFFYLGDKLFSNEENQHLMVGLLYMIYCLWHSRPPCCTPSVRIVSTQVKIISDLYTTTKAEGHLDVLYVLCSLLRDGVFKFMLSKRDYGLEKYYRKYFKETHKPDSAPDETQDLNTLLDENNDVNIPEILTLMEEYKNALQECKTGTEELISGSKSANADVFLEMAEDIRNMDDNILNSTDDYMGKKERILARKFRKEDQPEVTPGTSKDSDNGKQQCKRRLQKDSNLFFDYDEEISE